MRAGRGERLTEVQGEIAPSVPSLDDCCIKGEVPKEARVSADAPSGGMIPPVQTEIRKNGVSQIKSEQDLAEAANIPKQESGKPVDATPVQQSSQSAPTTNSGLSSIPNVSSPTPSSPNLTAEKAVVSEQNIQAAPSVRTSQEKFQINDAAPKGLEHSKSIKAEQPAKAVTERRPSESTEKSAPKTEVTRTEKSYSSNLTSIAKTEGSAQSVSYQEKSIQRDVLTSLAISSQRVPSEGTVTQSSVRSSVSESKVQSQVKVQRETTETKGQHQIEQKRPELIRESQVVQQRPQLSEQLRGKPQINEVKENTKAVSDKVTSPQVVKSEQIVSRPERSESRTDFSKSVAVNSVQQKAATVTAAPQRFTEFAPAQHRSQASTALSQPKLSPALAGVSGLQTAVPARIIPQRSAEFSTTPRSSFLNRQVIPIRSTGRQLNSLLSRAVSPLRPAQSRSSLPREVKLSKGDLGKLNAKSSALDRSRQKLSDTPNVLTRSLKSAEQQYRTQIGRPQLKTISQLLLQRQKRLDAALQGVKKIRIADLLKLDKKIDQTRKRPTVQKVATERAITAAKRLLKVLSRFIDPALPISKRLTSELSISELEMLIEMFRGRRALKALRKKGGVTTDTLEETLREVDAISDPNDQNSTRKVGESESPTSNVVDGGGITSADVVADQSGPSKTLSTVMVKNPG